jgi:FkbM family methyltransferase
LQTSHYSWIRNFYRIAKHIPGIGKVLSSVVHCVFPYGTRVWVRVTAGLGKGLWLNIDPRYETDYWNGNHEPTVQRLLAERLRPGWIFYDIGAHIGFFSLIAARLVGKDGKIFAFEADPENAARLKEHIQKNALHQVEVVQVAVWSEDGYVRFQRSSKFSSRNTGAVASADDPTKMTMIEGEIIQVSSITLDNFVQAGNPPPHFVKVDVEGGEVSVLKGMKWVLQSQAPILLIEIHSEQSLWAVSELLSPFKYAIRPLLGKADHFPSHFIAEPQ